MTAAKTSVLVAVGAGALLLRRQLVSAVRELSDV